MPDRLSYDEAMLFASARLRIQDPDLKHGRVETLTTQTAAGIVERPWGIEGGFAVVYKFRTRSGKLRALRCFRVPIDPDTQFRYRRIGPYFQAHARNITVDFKYHVFGIAVREQGRAGHQVYPVIEMDWVEGVTLTERVDMLCRKRDSAALQQLGQQWLALLAALRQGHIAHGDLAGPNVMVKPGGEFVLIDYDGVYISEFAGFRQVLLGQADYQHPQKSQRTFNEHIDDFSALVIYTALLALAVQPELWDKYALQNAQGQLLDTNLLFTQQDFREPRQSPLLRELERLGDAQITSAVRELQRACLQPVDQVRFPHHLVDLDYEKKLKLRIALQNRNIEQIAVAYKAAPHLAQHLTEKEQQQAELAASFVRACATEDDREIAAAYDAIENFRHLSAFLLTPQQLQCAKRAQERRAALARFHVALSSKKIQHLVTAYDPILDASKHVSATEREQLALAQAFAKAYADDNTDALIVAYHAIRQSAYRHAFIFTTPEQQRVMGAQRQQEALMRFQIALRQRKPAEIVAAYDASLLETSSHITQEQRTLVVAARNYLTMYHAVQKGIAEDSNEMIRKAYDRALAAQFAGFLPDEQRRIDRAILPEQLEEPLARKEDGKAITMALDIQATTGQALRSATFRRLRWVGLLAMTTSAVVNLSIRAIALALFHLSPRFAPMGIGPVLFWSVLLAFGATVVFGVISRFARRPVRLFLIVAVCIFLLSFVPDLLLAISNRFAGTNANTVGTLWSMHIVEAIITIGMLLTLGIEQESEPKDDRLMKKQRHRKDFW